MIIFKDKTWQTLSGHPNDNWLSDLDVEQPLYVVDDNSDIARKIRQYKEFELVIEDGQLVGVKQIKTVEDLKLELANTDYKVIKCMEYQLAGLESPYDIQELNKNRQFIRDDINAMEDKKKGENNVN